MAVTAELEVRTGDISVTGTIYLIGEPVVHLDHLIWYRRVY